MPLTVIARVVFLHQFYWRRHPSEWNGVLLIKQELAFEAAVATAMVVVFQFQRLDFGLVFTTSGFSAIESDSGEFVMVNFVNFDGLF